MWWVACPKPSSRASTFVASPSRGFRSTGSRPAWWRASSSFDNESVRNLNNGIYPTLSANGLVQNNVSYGSLDTAMWVAGSENVRVIGNELFGSSIGFEITVSNNVWVTHNKIHDNTVGIGLFHPNAAGNPPKPVMANWVIEHNDVHDNNLPNPARAGNLPGARAAGHRDPAAGRLRPRDREEHGRGQRLRRDRGPRLVYGQSLGDPQQLLEQSADRGSCREQQPGLPEQA